MACSMSSSRSPYTLWQRWRHPMPREYPPRFRCILKYRRSSIRCVKLWVSIDGDHPPHSSFKRGEVVDVNKRRRFEDPKYERGPPIDGNCASEVSVDNLLGLISLRQPVLKHQCE